MGVINDVITTSVALHNKREILAGLSARRAEQEKEYFDLSYESLIGNVNRDVTEKCARLHAEVRTLNKEIDAAIDDVAAAEQEHAAATARYIKTIEGN